MHTARKETNKTLHTPYFASNIYMAYMWTKVLLESMVWDVQT